MLVIIMKFSLFTIPSLVFGLLMSPGHACRLRVVLRVDHTRVITSGLWVLFVPQQPASLLGEPAPPSLGTASAPLPKTMALPGFTPQQFPHRRGFPTLSVLYDGSDKPGTFSVGSVSLLSSDVTWLLPLHAPFVVRGWDGE